MGDGIHIVSGQSARLRDIGDRSMVDVSPTGNVTEGVLESDARAVDS
jgi:hypothetical protein